MIRCQETGFDPNKANLVHGRYVEVDDWGRCLGRGYAVVRTDTGPVTCCKVCEQAYFPGYEREYFGPKPIPHQPT